MTDVEKKLLKKGGYGIGRHGKVIKSAFQSPTGYDENGNMNYPDCNCSKGTTKGAIYKCYLTKKGNGTSEDGSWWICKTCYDKIKSSLGENEFDRLERINKYER